MSWKWLNLVTEYLNPDALAGCKDRIITMIPWVQGILVGAVFLLAGGALLELFFGLKMQKYARFVTGLSVGFAVCFVILSGYTDTETVRMLLYSLAAGVAAGLLYTFLERAYRFAEGFLFGTALASWLVPQILNKEPDVNPGRIIRLVIAIAAGVLFALLAKILRPVLSALLGGTILALLIEAFVPYESIPYLPQTLNLSEGMYRNILPLVLAGIGFLIQLPQWVTQVREEKERKAAERYVEEQTSGSSGSGDSGSSPEESEESTETDSRQIPAGMSVAEAEAVLVEKARELALAASRNAEEMRLHERYEDVAEGLYSAQAAADRLGMTESQFLEGMKQSGYTVPGSEGSEQEEEQIPETAQMSEEEKAPEEAQEPEEEKAPEEAQEPEEPEAAEQVSEESEEQTPAEQETDEQTPAEQETDVQIPEDQETEEQPEGEPDGIIREESADLPQEGQTDLGEDQRSPE